MAQLSPLVPRSCWGRSLSPGLAENSTAAPRYALHERKDRAATARPREYSHAPVSRSLPAP
eukprot:2533158-Prymnesium_polylepis.1